MEPFHRLGHKLHTTAKALRSWSALLISDAKLKFYMVQVLHDTCLTWCKKLAPSLMPNLTSGRSSNGGCSVER
jgi:hypothetical protein